MGRQPGPVLDDYAARVRDGQAFVAEVDGAHGEGPAGVIVLIEAADHLLLDNVVVRPGLQGRGIGRALMGFAEAEARRRRHGEIRLYTHEAMTENQALYRRLGYEETGRGVQQGYARVFMRKRLQATA